MGHLCRHLFGKAPEEARRMGLCQHRHQNRASGSFSHILCLTPTTCLPRVDGGLHCGQEHKEGAEGGHTCS